MKIQANSMISEKNSEKDFSLLDENSKKEIKAKISSELSHTLSEIFSSEFIKYFFKHT